MLNNIIATGWLLDLNRTRTRLLMMCSCFLALHLGDGLQCSLKPRRAELVSPQEIQRFVEFLQGRKGVYLKQIELVMCSVFIQPKEEKFSNKKN